MAGHIPKDDLLKDLNDMIHNWTQLKGKEQDVTTENFVDNILYALRWFSDTVEKYPESNILS